jgi:hypothetical protein
MITTDNEMDQAIAAAAAPRSDKQKTPFSYTPDVRWFVPLEFAQGLERETNKLRDELFAAQSAVSVKDKALSRLYCAEMASIGAEFSGAIQAEIEDAMKQAKKAINSPLTP